MEKLIKKRQKKDGALTASSSFSNIDRDDDPFEEITRSKQNGWIVRHARIRLPGGGYVFFLTDK